MSAAPWGYAEFLDAIDAPKHERHAELKDWIEDDFDPNVVDTDELANALTALAKSWSRKSPANRATGLTRGARREDYASVRNPPPARLRTMSRLIDVPLELEVIGTDGSTRYPFFTARLNAIRLKREVVAFLSARRAKAFPFARVIRLHNVQLATSRKYGARGLPGHTVERLADRYPQ